MRFVRQPFTMYFLRQETSGFTDIHSIELNVIYTYRYSYKLIPPRIHPRLNNQKRLGLLIPQP